MPVRSALFDRLTLHAPHLSNAQVIPAYLYGTAWKKDRTADLTYEALKTGFAAIDTACQPKHYREDLVGEGLRRAINEGVLKRSEVYLQTKFTSVDGHDPTQIPYNPGASLEQQAKQSIETSLRHLTVGTGDHGSSATYLDCVVLHSPLRDIEQTMTVWNTLETFVPHKILNLGISNVSFFTLMELYERATIKPAVVQNRFHAGTKFDIGTRKFCVEKNIVYQSFWTLSANPSLLRSQPVLDLASRLKLEPASALYCLVFGLGNVVILNGTTKVQHMRDDLAAVSSVQEFATNQPSEWASTIAEFQKCIGEPPFADK